MRLCPGGCPGGAQRGKMNPVGWQVARIRALMDMPPMPRGDAEGTRGYYERALGKMHRLQWRPSLCKSWRSGDDARGPQVVRGQAGPVHVVANAPAEDEAAETDPQARAAGQEERGADGGVDEVLVLGAPAADGGDQDRIHAAFARDVALRPLSVRHLL